MPSPTIYFIQSDDSAGPVKIGYTARPVRFRLAEAQTFHPGRLYVLAEALGARSDEAKLHRVFRHLRLSGEWFVYATELRELVVYLLDGGNLRSWLDEQAGD